MTVTPETPETETPQVLTFDPGPPDPFLSITVPDYRELADYFVGRVAEVGDAVRLVCVTRGDRSIGLNLEVIE